MELKSKLKVWLWKIKRETNQKLWLWKNNKRKAIKIEADLKKRFDNGGIEVNIGRSLDLTKMQNITIVRIGAL